VVYPLWVTLDRLTVRVPLLCNYDSQYLPVWQQFGNKEALIPPLLAGPEILSDGATIWTRLRLTDLICERPQRGKEAPPSSAPAPAHQFSTTLTSHRQWIVIGVG
jgi:hypothetical protein